LDEGLDELFFATNAAGSPANSTVNGSLTRPFLAIVLGAALSVILFFAEGFFVINFMKGGQVTRDALFSKNATNAALAQKYGGDPYELIRSTQRTQKFVLGRRPCYWHPNFLWQMPRDVWQLTFPHTHARCAPSRRSKPSAQNRRAFVIASSRSRKDYTSAERISNVQDFQGA
jgi:hypothetical protein